jgi:hypothetical protein
MPADAYRPSARAATYPAPAYPAPAYAAAPPGYPVPAYPAPAPGYVQPQPQLRPVFAPTGEVIGYVAVPPPGAPSAAVKPASANQQVGQAALTTVTTGLGIAGVFAPPVLPIAAVAGLVQAVDGQLGHPITQGVGAVTRFVGRAGETVIQGVGDAGRGVGRFFGSLFGGK